MKFEWAPSACRRLHGVFCVYKPSDMNLMNMIESIQFKLAKDLNSLPCYLHERKESKIIPNTTTTLPASNVVPVGLTDLSDHRLVLGPRYIPSDFPLRFSDGLSRHSSGVQVLGIGRGKKIVKMINDSKFLRVYQIKARFGMVTHNFSIQGRLLQKTTFHHITRAKVDKACSAVEAQHQKHLLAHAKVDSQSQEAYELACQGLIRPFHQDSSTPILYGVRCIDFNLPNFTLEVHTLDEKASYLMLLVHELGMLLKSTAVCTQLRRIRQGHFTLEHALVRKFWTLKDIIENIEFCKPLTTADKIISPELLSDPTKFLDREEQKLLEE